MLFPSFTEGGDRWFVPGVNYPAIWHSGNDIGPNELTGHEEVAFDLAARSPGSRAVANAPTSATVLRDFRIMHACGIRAVRMWAFEKGEGLTWTRGRNQLQGLHSVFMTNVRSIMRAAQQAGVRIYWTFLNASDFDVSRAWVRGLERRVYLRILEFLRGRDRSTRFEEIYQGIIDYIVRRGHQIAEEERSDQRIVGYMRRILSDDACFRSYINRVVLPFVQVMCREFPGAVFAIDLMNEADWLWLNMDPEYWRNVLQRYNIPLSSLLSQTVIDRYNQEARQTETEVITWLNRMAAAIKSRFRRDILVSAGFALHNTVTRNHARLISFDFYDFHNYVHHDVNDVSGDLPPCGSVFRPFGLLAGQLVATVRKPCIIGECGLGGQTPKRLRLPLSWIRRPRVSLQHLFDDQGECIMNYLTNALQRDYAGCFVWEYGRQIENVFLTERRLNDTAVWTDRYPLLWKKVSGAAVSPDYCFHAPGEPTPPDLCGRPALRRIFEFTQRLGTGAPPPAP